MIFRGALIEDIKQMQIVRHLVKENVLTNPDLVPDKDVETYLTKRGRGWVCEIRDTVVGFSIADLAGHNIWALFILPEYEGQGIGKKLHELMLDWYFSNTKEAVWLSTAPASRAEGFYSKVGWKKIGIYGKGEIKFELTFDDWREIKPVTK
jgi:GNAT superfamily N-acetyltransferase